jgi:hypothetical protein
MYTVYIRINIWFWPTLCMKALAQNVFMHQTERGPCLLVLFLDTLRHLSFDGLKHLFFDTLRHLSFDSLKHLFLGTFRHLFFDSLKHLFLGTLRHFFFDSLKYLCVDTLRTVDASPVGTSEVHNALVTLITSLNEYKEIKTTYHFFDSLKYLCVDTLRQHPYSMIRHLFLTQRSNIPTAR